MFLLNKVHQANYDSALSLESLPSITTEQPTACTSTKVNTRLEHHKTGDKTVLRKERSHVTLKNNPSSKSLL
jgi:hypothetical protein